MSAHHHSDAAAYVLGSLEPSEDEAFRRHLAGCVLCRDEVAAFARTLKRRLRGASHGAGDHRFVAVRKLIGDADIARLHTPLGLPIGASTPEEIAVSAMAEIVAARRGVPVREAWVPPTPRAEPEARDGKTRERGRGVEKSCSGTSGTGEAKVLVAENPTTEEGSRR